MPHTQLEQLRNSVHAERIALLEHLKSYRTLTSAMLDYQNGSGRAPTTEEFQKWREEIAEAIRLRTEGLKLPPKSVGTQKGEKTVVHATTLDTNAIPHLHPESWFAQTLASHNGTHLKFRVMRDTTAEFHVHPNSPECFFVLSGTVHIDTEADSVTLLAGHFFEVPAGKIHRSRVEGEATLLVFDGLAI